MLKPKLPSEVDNPETLRPDLIRLRDRLLTAGDIPAALLLSHSIAWMRYAAEASAYLADAPAERAVRG